MFLRPGEIIRYLKDKNYILKGMTGADFGCGSGYFTALLAEGVGLKGKIYAIDIQEEILKEAQEFINNLGLRNIKFLKEDLEKSSGLESNSLDFVFISQVLYQSDEPEKIIREAYKVLKKGGYLIILEPNRRNVLFQNQNVYEIEKLIDFIRKENFQIIETEEESDYFLIISQK